MRWTKATGASSATQTAMAANSVREERERARQVGEWIGQDVVEQVVSSTTGGAWHGGPYSGMGIGRPAGQHGARRHDATVTPNLRKPPRPNFYNCKKKGPLAYFDDLEVALRHCC